MSLTKKINNLIPEHFEEISGPIIQLYSNKKIIVEGCYGINEYNNDVVKINLPRGQLIVFGRDLEIINMEEKTVIIKGILHSFEFSGEFNERIY